MIAEVKLPTDDTPIDPRRYDDSRGGMLSFYTARRIGGYSRAGKILKIAWVGNEKLPNR
jgi:hypothetical protein